MRSELESPVQKTADQHKRPGVKICVTPIGDNGRCKAIDGFGFSESQLGQKRSGSGNFESGGVGADLILFPIGLRGSCERSSA
jgi:hypothetical protein